MRDSVGEKGRNQFARYRVALRFCTTAVGAFPRFIRVWLWAVVAWMPGRLGAAIRYCIAASLAKQLGDSVLFGPHVVVLNWEHLSVGGNVSIHQGCYVEAAGGITIGNDVSIAHGCSLLSANHTWDDIELPIRDNPVVFAQLRICDDVWVGCGARLLAGVTVGTRSVVAAGAVVTKDVAPFSVVAGVPARRIKVLRAPG